MKKMIQIRNVPDVVHRRLKARAAQEGMTLSDFLLREIIEIAERPSFDELFERIQSHEPVEPKLTESSANALRAEREG